MSVIPVPYRGFIFDLDGVLVNTFKYHYQAWRRVANSLGFEFTEEQHLKLQGYGRMESLEKLLEWGGLYLPDGEKLHWADVKNNWYIELVAHMTPEEVLPGVRAFLQSAKAEKIATAVVSSSRNVRSVLESTRLESFFDAVIDGNIIRKAKPDPERYLLAAAELGCTAGECLVFEDDPKGVLGASYRGFAVVGIGSPEYLKGANLVISGFDQVLPVHILSHLSERLV